MSINVPPPEFEFPTLFYNPNFWITSSTSLSQSVANTLYLRKTVTDSASALETFNAGIKSSSYDVTSPALIKYMFSSQTADANLFENMGSSTTLKIGNQTTPQSVHVSYIDCRNNTINNALSPAVGNLFIGNSQTTGALSLGSSSRTSGAINIWKSLTPLYTAIPTSAEIGYRLNQQLGTTFSVGVSSATMVASPSVPIGTWLIELTASFSTGTVSVNMSLASSGTGLDFTRMASGAAAGVVRLVCVVSQTTATVYNINCSASAATTFANVYFAYTRIA